MEKKKFVQILTCFGGCSSTCMMHNETHICSVHEDLDALLKHLVERVQYLMFWLVMSVIYI